MKNINEYVIEGLNDIILQNLNELSDEEIVNEVRDYEGDDLSEEDILKIWNELKSKLKNPQAWTVTPHADIDKYNDNCTKWAKDTIKKYRLSKVKDLEKIVIGIAWVVNGL